MTTAARPLAGAACRSSRYSPGRRRTCWCPLLVVQWPMAYLLRPARVWAAPAPMAALLSVVAAISTINPGT